MAWLLWFLLAAMLLGLVYRPDPSTVELETWKDFKQLVRDGGVKSSSVVLKNDRVQATVKADYESERWKEKPTDQEKPVSVAIDPENRDFFLQQLESLDVSYHVETSSGSWWLVLLGWLPILLLFAFLWFIMFRARQAAESGAMGMLGRFGRSQHRVTLNDNVEVTFEDVAGIQEAKAEVQELITFLRDPERFRKVGARVPRGVLLLGPPGCGKTLLARAIAGEADVPFFSLSGSDFIEMFVGVGASRVRDLFRQAKQNAPCIIFLDEMDSVGRKRGLELAAGGGHDEREQTLNAILSEMDGFEPHDQVIVIAATNRPDVLDPALVRPGRFDRPVSVPLPDIAGRRSILEIHAQKVKLADDVNLQEIARATPMFSGADLAALINEAAIIAVMNKRDRVRMGDLQQARDKVRFGRAETSRRIDEHQRVINAYHEAGHALLQSLLEDADPIEKVTIIPRGKAMGATFALPEKDRYALGRRYLLATMRVLCGGRIAEEHKSSDISSGAEDDIRKISQLAQKMVREWGMSREVGFVRFTSDDARQRLVTDRGYSERTAGRIDQEIRRLVDEAFADAERMLKANWRTVESIAEALLERETLTADEIQQLIDGGLAEEPNRQTSPEQRINTSGSTEPGRSD
jgi:cell division protease FtsH